MARLVIWSPEEAKAELGKRLSYAKVQRRGLEGQWDETERTLYSTKGTYGIGGDVSLSFESQAELGLADADNTAGPTIGINYTLKNLRFIHSQLSANPPSVVARPTSNDPSDRRKADAADRLIRYGIRKYKLQELFDLCSLYTLQYGTGFVKTTWDPDLGDVVEFNEETGELLLEGDISVTVPNPKDLFLDQDATTWDEVKYIFERVMMPWEEAIYRFGDDKKELLLQHRIEQDSQRSEMGNALPMDKQKYDVVEVYQYWEKGLPYNGMVGRYCWLVKSGDLLTPVKPNPFRFSPPKDRGMDIPGGSENKELPAKAHLPYHCFTDLDVAGQVWGRSMVSYQAPLQDVHNRLTNVILDCLQAHGTARIVLPEGTEIADGSITNSPLDIIRITGTQPPHFMAPMGLPPALDNFLMLMEQGIDAMAGVNEAMFGQQSREQSGFSMQYATNQGNTIRRRLFNKYVLLTESVFKAYLNLVRKHWSETRTIFVLGKEKAFEALDIKGADISGGFDLVVEYGASLSLDPTTRREEIITLMPIFREAGVDTRTIMQMLKLNELEGLYDAVQLAADRQREIFEEMTAGPTPLYIAPKELQDHTNMLKFAYHFIMTTEFKYMPPEKQALIERHIRERETLAAQGAAPAEGALPQAAPGGLPALAGPQAEATVTTPQSPQLINQ